MVRAVLDPAAPARARGAACCCTWSWARFPIGIAGPGVQGTHIEGPLRSLRVIAVALIVVAVLMALADRLASGQRELGDVRLRDALLIGAAQALALVPGVSRSGITLVAGMALGLRRDAAARFSFLLSVPAIGAAGVFELPKVLRAQGVERRRARRGPAGRRRVRLPEHRMAACVSFAAGPRLPFVVYRVALGILLLVGIAAGMVGCMSRAEARLAASVRTLRAANQLPGAYLDSRRSVSVRFPTLFERTKAKDSKAGPIAQRSELAAHNRLVPGSNPGGPTRGPG